MARGLCTFREADVKRALKAARAAGFDNPIVEIDPATGKIRIEGRSETAATAARANEWDAKP